MAQTLSPDRIAELQGNYPEQQKRVAKEVQAPDAAQEVPSTDRFEEMSRDDLYAEVKGLGLSGHSQDSVDDLRSVLRSQ